MRHKETKIYHESQPGDDYQTRPVARDPAMAPPSPSLGGVGALYLLTKFVKRLRIRSVFALIASDGRGALPALSAMMRCGVNAAVVLLATDD